MSIGSVGAAGGPKSEINVVPLIDILLVLIIIFMVITPLAPKGLEALLPQSEGSGSIGGPPPDAIVIQVGAGRTVRINAVAVTWGLLEARLSFIFRNRPEKVAFVRADDPVEFNDVAGVIAIMRDAGVEKIGLLTPRAVSGL